MIRATCMYWILIGHHQSKVHIVTTELGFWKLEYEIIGSEIFDPMRKKISIVMFWGPKNAVKKSTIFHLLVLLQSRVVAQLLALVFRIVNSTVATRPKTFLWHNKLGWTWRPKSRTRGRSASLREAFILLLWNNVQRKKKYAHDFFKAKFSIISII